MKRPIIVMSITVLCACGGSQAESAPGADETLPEAPPEPPSEGGEAPIAGGEAPQTFAEQVSLGQELYGAHCASCHGDSGQGGDAPAVVGLDKGALPLDPPAKAKHRKTQFKTVADVADFVVQNMPAKKPGSLTAEQYWAILAFDLKANGIDLGEKKLDATVAPTLEIPRK
jgi:cytochrome c